MSARRTCTIEETAEDDVPDEWNSFIQLNADKSAESENITDREDPLADGS